MWIELRRLFCQVSLRRNDPESLRKIFGEHRWSAIIPSNDWLRPKKRDMHVRSVDQNAVLANQLRRFVQGRKTRASPYSKQGLAANHFRDVRTLRAVTELRIERP